MAFAENINRLCAEKGITLTTLVKTVKGSSSFTTNINRGALPKEHEMVEMAKILGCSVMDFFTDDPSSYESAPISSESAVTEAGSTAGGLDEDEQEILRMFRGLTNKERHKFMVQAYSYEETRKKG